MSITWSEGGTGEDMRSFVMGLVSFLAFVGATACEDVESVSPGQGGTGGSGGTTSSSGTDTGGGGAGGGGMGGGQSGSLLGDYCSPLAAFVCGRLASCGCGTLLPSGALDESACRSGYEAKCLAAYAPLEAAVASGSARILADAAHACVEALDASTPGCERPRGVVAQALCPAWFTSDAALGDACDFPFCAEGDGICVDGSCEPRPPESEPCALGGVCAVGLVCLEGTCTLPGAANAVCQVDDACGPPLRCVGGACAALGETGGQCGGSEECSLGLVCGGAECAERPEGPCLGGEACGNLTLCAAPRKCDAKEGAGATCNEDAACVDGFRCDEMTLTCVENPGLGMPCANSVLCAAGLTCTTDNGNCVEPPGLGEACGFGSMGPFVCEAGLGCVEGACALLPGDGQTCTQDSRCAEGLGCDFTAQGSVCVPFKGVGGECQNNVVCGDGLYCDFGVGKCAAVLPAGAPCKDGNECGTAGTCIPGNGGAFECAPMPTAGQSCLFECAVGLHCAPQAAASFCAPEVCKDL